MPFVMLAALFLPFLCQVESASPDQSLRTQDLKVFREQFLAVDRSFSPEARRIAEQRLQDLETEGEELSDAEFQLRLAAIAALADNGHTVLLSSPWSRAFNRIPLQFLVTDDGLWVAHAEGPLAELVGSQVLRVEDLSWEDLRRRWREYQGGLDGFRQQYIYYFLESPEVLHAAGMAEQPDELSLVLLREVEAEPHSVTIPARTDLPPLQGSELFLPPDRAVELTRRNSTEETPLYLRDPHHLFQLEMLEEWDAVYVQFRSNTGADRRRRIDDFVEEVRAFIEEQVPRDLIVDQRHNVGGDLHTTRKLMQELPDLMGKDSRIYLLLSGRTFSAGISSAAYLKQAGGDRVVILGQPPGDRLEFWAEGNLMRLEHSGAALLLATERHNYVTGCPEPDCHAGIRDHPIQIESLNPDYPVKFYYADFAAGFDPVLEKVQELIEQE